MTPEPPINAFVMIGNDTSLSQIQWAKYHGMVVEELIRGGGRILADWYSQPTAQWQGICFWVEVQPGIVARLQETLCEIARGFGQPAIGWSETAATTYLR